jgi:hypothetical protein
MCASLRERFYSDIEPDSGNGLSNKRIRELAFAKLHQQVGPDSTATNYKSKEKHMKASVKILLVAAIVCAMSLTAFAAFGGMDFFKSIFGDSAAIAEDQIQFPDASVENDDYRLNVESLLSDGYKTDIIVSLTAKSGARLDYDPMELFITSYIWPSDAEIEGAEYGFAHGNGSPRREYLQMSEEGVVYSIAYTEMPEFSNKDKKYYHLEMNSLDNTSESEIKISLMEDISPLSVTVSVSDSLTARKDVQVRAEDYADKNYFPETVQLSPMGVLVIGSEKEAKGGLPTAAIYVIMNDGTSEELISAESFDSEDDGKTISGGGSAIILGPGQEAPLVIGTMGSRNPDGKMVTSGSFSRILDLDEVMAISVDGVEYPLQ